MLRMPQMWNKDLMYWSFKIAFISTLKNNNKVIPRRNRKGNKPHASSCTWLCTQDAMPNVVDKVGYPEKSHRQLQDLTWFQKAFCLLWKLPTSVHLEVNQNRFRTKQKMPNPQAFNNIRRIKTTPHSFVYWKTHENTGSLG